MKKNRDNYNLKELNEIFANPSHPEYDNAQRVWKKHLGSKETRKLIDEANKHFQPLLDDAKRAFKEADELIDLITNDQISVAEARSMPPVSMLSVLALVSRMENSIAKKAKEILSERNSGFAKRPRIARQHPDKLLVKEYWDKLQKNPNIYNTRSDFYRDMFEKTNVKQEKTLKKWIKEWKEVPS